MVRANWDLKTLDLMEDSFLSSPLLEEEGKVIEIPDLEVQMMMITKIKTKQPRQLSLCWRDINLLSRKCT